MASLVLLVRASAPDLVLAALGSLVGLAFHRNKEINAPQHAAHRRVVRQLSGLVHAPNPQLLAGRADLRLGADRAFHESCFERLLRHATPLRRLAPPPPQRVGRVLDLCMRPRGACPPSARYLCRAARRPGPPSSASAGRPASRAPC